jgi:hypothetical protein
MRPPARWRRACAEFSRDDEREADLVGMDLAARAGFDPRAGIALWQKMGAVNKSQPPPSCRPTRRQGPHRGNERICLVLPVYARAKGLDPDAAAIPFDRLRSLRTAAHARRRRAQLSVAAGRAVARHAQLSGGAFSRCGRSQLA